MTRRLNPAILWEVLLGAVLYIGLVLAAAIVIAGVLSPLVAAYLIYTAPARPAGYLMTAIAAMLYAAWYWFKTIPRRDAARYELADRQLLHDSATLSFQNARRRVDARILDADWIERSHNFDQSVLQDLGPVNREFLLAYGTVISTEESGFPWLEISPGEFFGVSASGEQLILVGHADGDFLVCRRGDDRILLISHRAKRETGSAVPAARADLPSLYHVVAYVLRSWQM